MRPLRFLRWLACLAPALAGPAAGAAERADVEAAIVYNLLSFVEWPSESAPAPGAPLVLCLDPSSRLQSPLKALAGRPVRSHPLALKDVAAGEPSRGCQALLVEASLRGSRRPSARLPGILVIGDEPAVPDDGVAIRLVESDGRVAFDVDLAAARTARLQISSRLLRLARRVGE